MLKQIFVCLIFCLAVALFCACENVLNAILSISPNNQKPVVVCGSQEFTAKSTNDDLLHWTVDGYAKSGQGPSFVYTVGDGSEGTVHTLTLSVWSMSPQFRGPIYPTDTRSWTLIDGDASECEQ